jgi:hypothetical protein
MNGGAAKAELTHPLHDRGVALIPRPRGTPATRASEFVFVTHDLETAAALDDGAEQAVSLIFPFVTCDSDQAVRPDEVTTLSIGSDVASVIHIPERFPPRRRTQSRIPRRARV